MIHAVKSGYRIALRDKGQGIFFFLSRNKQGVEETVVLKIQPKVKSFLWRLVRDSSPTRAALMKKRVQLDDPNCLFCKANDMLTWVVDMMGVLQKGQMEMFVMLLWGVWHGLRGTIFYGMEMLLIPCTVARTEVPGGISKPPPT
ncbi:hypothetical protein ACLB2K_030900 [Fragaria x ananassa]